MGDQCINAKPPATPRPTPHLAAPRPAEGLGWWQGEGGQGEACGMGKGKGGKEKNKEKKIYIIKNPESLQMARPGWAWWLRECLGALGRGKQGQRAALLVTLRGGRRTGNKGGGGRKRPF